MNFDQLTPLLKELIIMQMQFIQFYLSRPLGGHMAQLKRAEVGGGRGHTSKLFCVTQT